MYDRIKKHSMFTTILVSVVTTVVARLLLGL